MTLHPLIALLLAPWLTTEPAHWAEGLPASLAHASAEPAPAIVRRSPKFALDEAEKPWRLAESLGLPAWLALTIEQRTRYEALSEDFRTAGADSHNHLFALRTLIAATANFETYRVVGELMDSRQYGVPDDGVLDTTTVDAVELLQGFLGVKIKDPFGREGSTMDLRLGRQTLDLGSRRLVARNAFRNTINAFTGGYASWELAKDSSLQAFYFHPVNRLPADRDSLEDNDVRFDEELEGTRFFGLFGTAPLLDKKVSAEGYVLGLDEEDKGGVATRDRELWTIGARMHQKPKAGETHFEWESAFQFGESRSSTNPANTNDLDHEAQFHHLMFGYSFEGEKKVRLEGLFDYASGDKDTNDGDYNRFDTLFGARRFEFGPTGIFGAFARSNLISPGARVSFNPWEDGQISIAHRLHYLASDEDAWTTSGLVDPSGSTDRFIGQLFEISVRHDFVPKNLRFEVGLARLFAEDFIDDAPNNAGQGDSTYGYVSLTTWL